MSESVQLRNESIKFECFAGRMMQVEGKVKPDPRKGKIRLSLDDQGMTHFQWVDLTTGNIEEDIVVFSFDGFSKVVQTKSRVYLLEYSGERAFYWLQDPDSSKDPDICKSIDDIIKNQEINDDPQPASIPEPQRPQPSNTNPLAQILAQFSQGRLEHTPSLDKILTPEVLDSLSQDPELQEVLIPHLPEGQNSIDFLRENLLSPQLQQALKVISAAINSEAGHAVISSLGLHQYIPPMNEYGDFLDALIKAIQRKADANRRE
mmetsp:Transcript_32957/g.32640  ORF Transcript_32957/g.32640 Transcript_32957/m.32640 type:complete len:262 (+) Transcript_32957:19-804(+)